VLGAAHPPEVDPVEQHRELRGVDLDRHRGRVHVRQLELAALEPLVDEDEAALVPSEDLHAVAAARHEDEEPEYASCASSSCTMPISPSIDFLMSMGVEPMKIRTDRGMVITGYSAAARARR
jgi:hypothetical protein